MLHAIAAAVAQAPPVVIHDKADPSAWVLALAGGAIGAVLAGLFAVSARAASAWADVTDHDEQAADLNRQLEAWTDDRTRVLVQTMNGVSSEMAGRGLTYSGAHGTALMEAKTLALHEFRDQKWRVELALARLRASEGAWHLVWRRTRKRRQGLSLPAVDRVEPFLDRWREPVTRHDTNAQLVPPFDPTRRNLADALAELPDLKLT